MRIALFTPLSPLHSALVDLMEGLLPSLAEVYDITLVTDGSYQPTTQLCQPDSHPCVPWISYDQFQAHPQDYDLVIYQLGDEPNVHGYMFHALHRYPGLLFLHDLVLHHAIAELTLNRGDPDAYIAEMRYSYGDEGERLARQVMSGQGEMLFNRYPLVERVLDSSLGVIVTNHYMCERIRALRPEIPVRCLPLYFHLPQGWPTDFCGAASRRSLGLERCPVVATFGLFNSQKRLEVSLQAFKRLLRRYPTAVYLLVGAQITDVGLQAKLDALGLQNNVRLTGWLDAVDFVKYMFVTDVAVQLRYPHIGGTPYTPIRLLGLGVPTIISDIEPLADFPPDSVVRIAPETPDEEALLFAAVDYLLGHRDVARAMAARAQAYVAVEHSLARTSEQIVDFIREIAARRDALCEQIEKRRRDIQAPRSASTRLTRVAGRALADLGVLPSNTDALTSVARIIHELEP
jgi:glycosyltransferase involved in cell wall biosynthesis